MAARVVFVIGVSVIFLLAGGALQESEAAKKPVMAMVTNQSGLGDQAFNDATWAGFILAQEKLGIEPKVLESREQAQYVPNLSILADQNCDLVVGVGFMIKDAVKEVADLYPDINFGLVDGIVDSPNVACLLFKENEGAFLMGAIAAKMSQTGTVGFVGGMSNPVTNRFEAGYRAGVKTVNPDMEVLVSYAGIFSDPAKGEEMAIPQYDQGADVIFQVAGGTGMGVINAAKKKDKWVIGVDRDQNYLAPDNVISSMIKRLDIAVFNAIQMVQDGAFKGGQYKYGIAEGGIDYAPTTSKNVPQEIIDYVEMLKEKIVKGEIQPPSTYEELDAFVPPAL
jgi:basic membrane protein A